MRNHVKSLVLAAAVMLACSTGARAQTSKGSSEAGKAPTTSTPAPEHDLSGVWNMHSSPAQRKYINSTYTLEGPEMTPWAKAKYEASKPSNGPRTHPLKETDDPVLRKCLPPGTPRIYLQPFPLQFVQTPKEIVMLYEYDHTVRQIFMDGRTHPADITPTYMGHSIGKWDGNTLVVDTVGFNERTWLDRDGHPHSDELHVTERFHRADRDNLQIDITMEDAKALAKPWVTTLHYQLKPDWDLMELVCTDNADFENFEK